MKVIFISWVENFKILDNNNPFFGDGTFTYCPSFFYQTVHTVILGHYLENYEV